MDEHARPASHHTPTFEIGLVLAGAVSGGAYTAGVLDFLFEALDEFEAAKARNDPECPRHDVRIRVMTGTSAGAMCVGLALQGLLRRATRPTPLHQAWVDLISAKALLTTRDLRHDEGGSVRVTSLLDSTVLEDVADKTLLVPKSPGILPTYIGERLDLGVCTAQLRGIPYSVPLVGSGAYGMRLHSVERWFHIDALEWRSAVPGASWWDDLRKTCIASGAFPIGLAPRYLDVPRVVYDERQWPAPGQTRRSDAPLKPDWPSGEGDEFGSYHVDGGLFNNEPLEMARERLSGSRLVENPRDGDKATRAVVMIDPFLEVEPTPAPTNPPGLFDLVPSLVGAMLHNARFKPIELELAVKETVYSRFVVAPRREGKGGRIETYACASGVLSAFGGFLSRAFREHDYQLGRRNCQKFLLRSFALYATNKIVDGWSHDAVKAYAFRELETAGDPTSAREFRPIVPLCGRARPSVAAPAWLPWSTEDRANLQDGLAKRAAALVDSLVEEHVNGPVMRLAVRSAWGLFGRDATGRLMKYIDDALEKREQG
jgi:hypothetical protein